LEISQKGELSHQCYDSRCWVRSTFERRNEQGCVAGHVLSFMNQFEIDGRAYQETVVDAPTTETAVLRNSSAGGPKISHAVLLTTAQLSRGFARLLFVIVAARGLGPVQFGVYVLLLAIVEMLAVASGSGYIDYLTRETARDERLGWGLASQLTWLRLACTISFAVIALGIFRALGYSRLVLAAAALMSLTLIPRSISEAVQGVLRGIGRYVEFFIIELAFALTLLMGAGFLLMRGGGLRLVIVTELAATCAAALVGLLFAVKHRTKQQLCVTKSVLFRTSAVFNIYAFVGNLYDRLDVVLLSKLAGNYATGVYGVAYRPIGTLQLLPYGVLYSLLPTMSRGSGTQLEREGLEKAMGLLLSTSFVIVLATMVFSDAAIPLLLGARFAESAAALKILVWAVIPRYLNYALNMSLLAARCERVFVTTSLICLVVNVIGNLVFIPMFSWRAAAALTIATELVLLAQNVYWLRRTTGSVPKPFGWARILPVFAAFLIAALAGARLVSPLMIGTACVLFFLMYLSRTGLVIEFAAAWKAERSTLA
jgi:O-antigen/teichoic acid export membrane protein